MLALFADGIELLALIVEVCVSIEGYIERCTKDKRKNDEMACETTASFGWGGAEEGTTMGCCTVVYCAVQCSIV